jgi:hypothetical protein
VNARDREQQLGIERLLIEEATERLLAGTAQRSSGRLNIVALAEEAGIGRARLYEHHPDLVEAFKSQVGMVPSSPDMQALCGHLDAVRGRIAELEAENGLLQDRIRTLSAVIVELSLHADTQGNVVPLR